MKQKHVACADIFTDGVWKEMHRVFSYWREFK